MDQGRRPKISIKGEEVTLLPERCVYWSARKTLLAADLHWGKSETFRHHGIPIPEGLIESDLTRLASVIRETGAERLLILGDLIHGSAGLTPALVERISAWRLATPIKMTVIRGNHDRFLKQVPPGWQLELVDEVIKEGPFAFSHEPKPVEGSYVWAGHCHPVFKLSGGGDRLRLPCFHLGTEAGILPAFSEFTGGLLMTQRSGDRVFVIAENAVVEW